MLGSEYTAAIVFHTHSSLPDSRLKSSQQKNRTTRTYLKSVHSEMAPHLSNEEVHKPQLTTSPDIILTRINLVLLFPHESSHQNFPEIPWLCLSHSEASPQCQPTNRRSVLATIDPNSCLGRKYRRPES